MSGMSEVRTLASYQAMSDCGPEADRLLLGWRRGKADARSDTLSTSGLDPLRTFGDCPLLAPLPVPTSVLVEAWG